MHFPIICSKYLCNCCWIFISVSLMWITFAKSACIFPCSNEVKVGNIFNQKLPSTHKKQRKNDNTREFRMQPKTWECFLLGQYNSRSSVWLPLAEGREHVKRPATNDRLEQARRAQSSWLDNSHNLDLIMQSEGGKSIFTFLFKNCGPRPFGGDWHEDGAWFSWSLAIQFTVKGSHRVFRNIKCHSLSLLAGRVSSLVKMICRNSSCCLPQVARMTQEPAKPSPQVPLVVVLIRVSYLIVARCEAPHWLYKGSYLNWKKA